MRVEFSTRTFTLTAILTAVKKQQPVADWRVVGSDDERILLEFENARVGDDEVARRLERQVIDEQLREKLEEEFGEIRKRLVDLALLPIIRA